METTEGNKLIAEFMGWTETDNDLVFNSNIKGTTSNSVFSGWVKKEQEYTRGVPLFVVKNNRTQIDYMRKNLKYHSSWDWLMPVVEKIESLTYINDNNETDYWFFKKGNHCVGFWLDTWGKPYQVKGVEDHTYSFRLQETLIQSTWLAVVEFIKWYNANK